MSYDIRIIASNDPHCERPRMLDVSTLVQAVNTFPHFAERGITWTNRRWNDYSAWAGLTIDLEGHDPGKIGPDRFDDEAGTCDACNLHISYGTDSDLQSCQDLAERIARAVGAKAWDLQLDRALYTMGRSPPRREWEGIRDRFRWLLRRRDS